VREFAELAPVRLGDVHTVVLGGGEDVLERQVAILVGDALHLIEPGDGIADVARIGHRFLAFAGKREDGLRQLTLVLVRQAAVLLVGLPG
jgi:hypothetical protein